MNNFWNNINKFPKFLIVVFTGFFLTTLQPIFELLTNKKKKIIGIIIIILFISTIYYILSIMLGIQ
uniref:Uncharacterized protein ycf33 n=1 Tax=Eucheuma denticulatum TaxID=305493 RepID=A0A8E7PI09_9FLOR|nr:hypothetical protein [Eucheuma denticulatum]